MMCTMKGVSFYAVLAVISFLLHLVWERLHIVLYTGYEALEGRLPVFVLAALGDVMYTLLVVALFALLCGPWWFSEAGKRTYWLLAVCGLGIAIFVEMKAQMHERWEYTDAMPIIAGFGLSPLVQMTVLLPLSVYLSTVVQRWISR